MEAKRTVKKKPPKATGIVLRPMAVTLKQTIRSTLHRPFTVMYPYEKLELPDCFRGRPGLIIEKCIACGICVRICPNKCIELVEVEVEGEKCKRPQVDVGRCMMCGYCAEYCPTDAFIVTPEYELASNQRRDFIMSPHELVYEHKPGYEVHRHEVLASELARGEEAVEVRLQDVKDVPRLKEELCIGCGRCKKVCPMDCVEMVEVGKNKKGKPIKRPRFDYSECIGCENCLEACPKDALEMEEVL
ncbi:MAG: 4Fe-4S binding protein [Methanomassiliicoccales archaeon]